MKVAIYQSYYTKEQTINLDYRNFIPFDNTENAQPQLREYPLHKKIYEKHKEDKDTHWGLVSWKWGEKIKSDGTFFVRWIKNNPGYDLYFIDPHIQEAAAFKNPFVNGDISHPGLMEFNRRLLKKLNLDIDLDHDGFHPDLVSTCTFWIGNRKFWNGWFSFFEECTQIIKNDRDLFEFAYGPSLKLHLGRPVINFPFIHERLISFYLYKQRNNRWIKYPYDSTAFYNKLTLEYGDSGLVFYKTLYLLQKKEAYCGNKLIKPMTDEEFGHKSKIRTPDGTI